MSTLLRLHYAPDNASLCVRLALEEMGLPYATALVDRRIRDQDSAAYRSLNPNGLIPTLETPDGPLFETAAILLWLADRNAMMMPGIDSAARGPALKWLFWLANTLHPALRLLFYPGQHIAADCTEELRIRTRERLQAMFALLEAATDADWLDADAPSIMACYLAPMLRWPALYGGQTGWFDLSAHPRLMAFARRQEARPAAQRAAAAEGLGPTPFSAPQHPTPPEGSAL